MTVLRGVGLIALAAVLLSAGAAGAETVKAFSVGATIASGCVVSTHLGGGGTWGAIDLGSTAGLSAQSLSADLVANGVSGLQISCTSGTTANITADQGRQPTGGLRNLAHVTQPANVAPYQLYANNSVTPWTSQSVPLAFGPGVQTLNLPISATASISGPLVAGSYADTVHVTVTW